MEKYDQNKARMCTNNKITRLAKLLCVCLCRRSMFIMK